MGTTIRAAAGRVLRALPERWGVRAFPQRLGYRASDVPEPIKIAPATRRLLVAPANSAGQGWAWARTAEQLPGVSAINLDVVRSGSAPFPADFAVPDVVFAHSRSWARAHVNAMRGNITDVLIESQRSILGTTCKHDIRGEATWLDSAGINRAYVSHGSDIRHPDRHAESSPWSPFRDADWHMRQHLVKTAESNAQFLDEQDAPIFVSTPELLADIPNARWLPNVVDPGQWHVESPALSGNGLRVLHAPTNEHIKGTQLIEPALQRLVAGGVIRYHRVSGAAPGTMVDNYANADVVLDQFRIGIYSTTALEAMAAGRLVIGFILPEVRAIAERQAGMPLPIVTADPSTIEDVLSDIARNPDEYRALAAAGAAFVRALHDGTYAAKVLSESLFDES